MPLFTKSLCYLNGWTHQPEHRGEGNHLLGVYAGHDGEMLGFTFSASVRNCQDFYKKALLQNVPRCLRNPPRSPLVKAMKSVIRDSAAGDFAQGANGPPPTRRYRWQKKNKLFR